MSTKEELARRVVDLELELKRVRQEALDAQVSHERFASGVVARADAARLAELAAEDLEEHRRRCWFQHRFETIRSAQDDDAFREFLSDSYADHDKRTLRETPDGWPPSYDPLMFQKVPATNHEPADDRSGSVPQWRGQVRAKTKA
jgi:hypothetical protein